MKIHSRRLYAILAAVLAAFLPAGCMSAPEPAAPADDNALSIVATIKPEYDWITAVLGDNPAGASVTLMLDNGVDLHSYQPTASDIMKISECDVFVYVGGESDKWVKDAMQEAVNKSMTVVNLLDVLGSRAVEEELPEGAEEEHEAEEEPKYDEHVWLSLQNAQIFVKELAEVMCEKDPEHADMYLENADAYNAELAQLDGEYEDAVSTAEYDTLLFGDRFPFRYLIEDYGLRYYAAFSGCSGETEASFETVLYLAGKLDELDLRHVMKIEGSDGKIADTIIRSSKDPSRDVLTLDSMQGETAAGKTYLDVMKSNLQVLKQALNRENGG